MRSLPAMLAFLASAIAFCLPAFGGPGWTPIVASGDSRLIYVSSSTGNDANDGLTSSTPKQTIAAGAALMRTGYPDWLQLKCGDTFTLAASFAWNTAGRSDTERAVFTSYGTGARPIITAPNVSVATFLAGAGSAVNPLSNIAVIGLELTPVGRVSGSGGPNCITFLGKGGITSENFLIEDCKLHGGIVGISAQGSTGQIRNLQIRRNIIYRNFGMPDSSQNVYLDKIDGIEITENFNDYGGWDPDFVGSAVDNIFSHAYYIQTNCTGTITIRGNITMRPSSHGLQARAGGTIQDNVFIECPVAFLTGGGDSPVAGGVTTTVQNNLVHGDRRINGSARGYGIDVKNILSGTVKNNLVVNKTTSDDAFAIGSYVSGGGVGVGVKNLNVLTNRVHNWRGGIQLGTSGQTYSGILVDGNILESRLGDTPRFEHCLTGSGTAGRTWSNNRYYNTAGGNCFYNAGLMNFATWASSAGESGSSFTAASSGLIAPPDIKSVVAALSGTPVASLDDLSAIYTGRAAGTWNAAVSAASILAYYSAYMTSTAGPTWYIHSGNTSGGRDGTALAPYNSIAEWHAAVNGGGSSTTGIVGNCTLILCSGEGAYFREGPLVLNFGGDSTKSLTVRAWKTGDLALGGNGGTPQRPVLRGDVLLTSLTDNDGAGAGTLYYSNTLPAGTDYVDQVLFKYDDQSQWTKEGFRIGHVHVTQGVTNATSAPDGQQFDVSGVPVGLAAGAWAYNRTTRVLWVQTPADTTPANWAYVCSGYTAAEKSNALLCFQNVYNSSIEGLEFLACYEPTAGWYGASMENATNCAIRYCKAVDCSHHGFGFTGSSSRNTNCTIEYCEVYGLGGTTGLTTGDVYTRRKSTTGRSGAGVFIGNDYGTASCSVKHCTFHFYSHLDLTAAPLYTTTLQGAFLGSTATNAANVQSDLVVDDCRFVFYPAYLPTTTNSGPFFSWTNSSAPSSTSTASAYPVRVQNSQFVGMTGSTLDQGSGGSAKYGAKIACSNCLFDFSGFATQTARVKFDSVWNLAVPNDNASWLLFDKCLIASPCNNLAGQYTSMFSCNSGASTDRTEVWNLTMRDSAVAFYGGKTPATAYLSMFTFSGGAAGSLGMKVDAARSIFAYQEGMIREAGASFYGTRKLCDGDGNAVSGTELKFASCGYYNIRDGYYSLKGAYDTWTEWSATVDPTGVKFSSAPLLGLPERAFMNGSLATTETANFSSIPSAPGVVNGTGLGGLRGRGR